MRNLSLVILAVFVSACTAETHNAQHNVDQFSVIRNGINMDELAIKCAGDPQSVGFETSEECFAYAKELLENGQ